MRSGEQAGHEGQLNIWSPKISREDAIELLATSAVAKSCCKKQHIFKEKNGAVICKNVFVWIVLKIRPIVPVAPTTFSLVI
jgi:hypothetical protein